MRNASYERGGVEEGFAKKGKKMAFGGRVAGRSGVAAGTCRGVGKVPTWPCSSCCESTFSCFIRKKKIIKRPS